MRKKAGIMMVNSKIQAAEENLIHVYNRFPIALDHGKGMYLYDTEGKEYLDFAAGFAVCGLGYGNTEFQEALKEQIDKICHISNLYYHETCGEAAKELNRISGMDRVFFTNSGSEANEGALKAARRYAYTKKTGRYEFIAMDNSFHGRSFGAVSVTGHEAYREPFEPVLPGVKFARFNDLDSVKELVSEKTCAIILEPLQGEGGINLATQEFMEGIRRLCDEKGILMICDEVQCGMGRTGSMFAWQGFGVKPDILTMAKAIGNGIPVGAFAMTEEVAEYSLKPGDHGATYGGNPLACTAVKKAIEIFERDDIVGHVKRTAPYLEKRLEEIAEEFAFVTGRRGKGFMQGLVFSRPVSEINAKTLEEGLLVIQAQGNVIRFLPPLIAEEKHIDEMVCKLRNALKQIQ
jgi:acetylornithine/N-succinyldiaminopimelate aminotransferase|nr:aspartate aminotransferase family protein [Mediterraneibacter massiliensis]